MVTKTKFTKADFLEIVSHYQVGEYRSSKPISKGTVQTNYLLHTTDGKYVFRYYENRSLGSVKFESNLIEYLTSKNYPCPAQIKNKQGKSIGIFNEKPYILFEFVEGVHLKNPNEAQKRQLIKKVAELQIITRNYKSPYTKYRWNYDIELCRKLVKKEAEKLGTVNAREKLKWYESELLKLDLPKSLPKGICHCDFHFSNILSEGDKFMALIDFDHANYTYLSYDLATLINPFISRFDWNTWSKFKKEDDVFGFGEARKLVSEYSKYRSLSENEKKHLFDVFKLSIMIDCLWYFERGDAKDFYERRKIEYLNSLGRKKFYNQIFQA